MAIFLNLPGIRGSGEAHWQSLWEAENPAFRRFKPTNWNRPLLSDWLAALTRAVDEAGEPPILVAHSLGCLLVAHAVEGLRGRVRGAFLVAVPDPAGPAFPPEAAEFREVPYRPFPLPTMIVASSDDPYASAGYARRCARDWRAGIAVIGARGHINSASGVGRWLEGRMLLDAFSTGLGA